MLRPGGIIKIKDRDLNYCRNDNGILFAWRGPWGGIFRLSGSGDDVRWELLMPQSPHWNAVHQAIFYTGRLEPVRPEELPKGIPEVPEEPAGPFPSRIDYYLADRQLLISEYPKTATLVRNSKNLELEVHVVLREDGYETLLGDGEFHYLNRVFLRKSAAVDFVRQQHEDQMRAQARQPPNVHLVPDEYHLRRVVLALSGDSLVLKVFQHEVFDEHSAVDVLEMLETDGNRTV